MTRQEQNQIIKDSIVKVLGDKATVREDMVESYYEWVRGLIANTQQTPEEEAPANEGQGPGPVPSGDIEMPEPEESNGGEPQ